MTISAARPSRRASLAVAAAALATSCLSSTGHSPAAPTNPDCEVAPAVPAGQPFTVSGVARYDFVPATFDPAVGSGTLDFRAAEQRPIREAAVEIRQCAAVLATTTTDALGRYAATFTPGALGRVVVTVLAKTASPPIQVQDNTDGGAIWAVGQTLDAATQTLDVRATHGWTGAVYDPARRIAGPFAILDAIYGAAHRLLDTPRPVPFDAHPVVVNWSPHNVPLDGSRASGQIGGTHYDPATNALFILGAAGQDTDEFDREVIVHEWAHYFEDGFSRSDSPGGSHGFGDVLDPRLSFSEGFASAFAAILLDQPVYADTYWSSTGGIDAFGWDVETEPSPTDDPSPGPFSEFSVIRALWDLYDPANEGWDGVALGVGPIFDTLVGPQRTTPALTTVASFVSGLKAQAGVDAPAVDALLAHYRIGPIASPWGDGDASFRDPTAGIYTDLPSPSSSPLTRTVTFDGARAYNERAQNQYFAFTGTGARVYVTTASAHDVDLVAFQAGTPLAAALGSTGNETIRDELGNAGFATAAGQTYVVALTGWGGVSSLQTGVGAYDASITFSTTP